MAEIDAATTHRGTWVSRLFYTGLGFVATAIVGTVLVLMTGGVRGTEIDVMTFGVRTFHFYRIPFTKIQISPTWYDTPSNDFKLKISKHLTNLPRINKWRVATVYLASGSDFGDAKILDDVFSITNSQSDWIPWSDKHSKIADLFWPLVSEISQHDAYFLLPDFANNTRNAKSLEEFKGAVVTQLSSMYVELANNYLEANDFDHAIELATLALRHDSRNVDALRLRAAAYRQIGDTEQASIDQSAADELSAVKKTN